MEEHVFLMEIDQEIKFYLGLGSKPDLANCLEQVPEAYRVALYNLISDHQYNKTQKTIIAFHVTEDVQAIVDGKPAEFSKRYLTENSNQ